ncbi:hypothetical protein LTR36_004957 [Oleoguttula mirabilis]|uniref:Uracil permease n=1 Tax=Oleoguttula mirabilis TaxID=1507867 RepID=A0AAV9JWE9_9PEZI|nr:hypothetical protein LTR36_004957 [Oleoguttula mirabilis]
MSLLQRLQVDVTENEDSSISNKDTMPLPPSRRTYGPWTFVVLWVITGSFNIGGWTTGSSLIAYGLNVWQCMITVIVGNLIVGVMCVLSGAPGAKWHVGFPIIQKACWGTRGFYFPVIQRFFLACIWFSTQVFWGGECLKTFFTALWPSYRSLNTPLANGTMTTGDFLAFILFTILYLPLVWIKPERYKIPFLVCCSCIIPTVLALLIWFAVKARGGGDLLHDVSTAGVIQARGTNLAWMFVLGICTNISTISVHIFVQSDYTRYARRPKDQILAQLVMVPLGTIVVALIGIICTSCAATLFPEYSGTLLWEPYELLSALQLHYDDSSHARAAVAFASLAFMVAQFGQVVANNGVAGGLDLSALLPRYFNIRRGMLLLTVISFITQPWQLLNGASKFLTVLGGYGVFLGPMTGVMFCDYFVVRRRLYKLSDLYHNGPESIYHYSHGINWRAAIAWAMGVWLTLPGFARRVQGGDPLPGWSNMYYMSWPLGTLVSMLVYYVAHAVKPMPGIGLADEYDFFSIGGVAEVIDGQDLKCPREKDEKVPSAVKV